MIKSLLAAACLATAMAQSQNIVQIALATPELSTLVAALEAGNLVSALEGPGPFTVFAPVNTGFAALGPNILAYVLNPHNQGILDNVLTYHVANGAVTSNQLKDGEQIPTLDQKLTVTAHVSSAGVKINSANVIKANIMASNGVIHLIDSVLVPSNFVYPSKDIVQTALAVPALSTLVKAVVAGNLTGALSQPNGPYTVFAPTDDAFGKLPSGELNYLLSHPQELDAVLLYHVLPKWVYSSQIFNLEAARTLNGQDLVFFIDGSNVIINGYSNVVQANVDCSNGEVHLIDTVLIPNAVRERMNAALGVSSGAPLPNIVQLAEATPQLSTLVKAVVAGGLVKTLESPGPFTVFAPNDAAFAQLPNGVLAYLLNHVTDLDTVLTYHVVAGNVTSNQLSNGELVPTVEGANVTVTIAGSKVFINQAQVIAANVFASNGVVHLIDSVLLPPALF